jgi:hypothetical protein
MAIDYNRNPDARARAEGAGNAMGYIVGAVLTAVIIGMLMVFIFGNETPTGNTLTSPPTPNTQTTQPRAVTPPPSATPTTTPTAPAPTPSTR